MLNINESSLKLLVLEMQNYDQAFLLTADKSKSTSDFTSCNVYAPTPFPIDHVVVEGVYPAVSAIRSIYNT